MKKIRAFLCIISILFFVFACTIPSEIEVTGNPSLKFAADMDLGDFFSDMIDSVLNTGGEARRLDCTNPSLKYKTYLLYVYAFTDQDFECEDEVKSDGGENYISINGRDIKVKVILGADGKKQLKVIEPTDRDITSNDVEPYTVSSSGFGDYLEGFVFTDIKAKMYISGTDLVKAISIELYNINSEGKEIKISSTTPPMKDSGLESLAEYADLDLPPGGEYIDIIDIINSKEDLTLTYKLYLLTGEEIDYKCLKEPQVINIEVAIWLPMTFVSIEENARFNFQDFFDGIANVLKSIAGTGAAENMSVNIDIQPINPYRDGIFVIKDDNYDPIQNPLDDNSFSFDIEKKDIDYMNNNPFNPNFYVLYPEINSFLGIPNEETMITSVIFDTELKYNAEF